MDFSVASAKEKVARIEAYIEELSVAASIMLTSWVVRLRREMSLLVSLEVVVVLSVKIYERLHFDFGFVRDSEYNMPMAADHSDMRFAAFQ